MKLLIGALVSSLALSVNAFAATPAEAGEIVRSSLTEAQIEMGFDAVAAQKLVGRAKAAYEADLGRLGKADFAALETAIRTNNEVRFARESARVWTNTLNASYDQLEAAVKSGDFTAAREWLALREYRWWRRASRRRTPTRRSPWKHSRREDQRHGCPERRACRSPGCVPEPLDRCPGGTRDGAQ
ncbi:MAG: hypothetical protein HC933_10845 [Pleurocapsa sp. SU_196_0]|nr:hypothetical protein [Pleurocapsa sp. SU_196_0]